MVNPNTSSDLESTNNAEDEDKRSSKELIVKSDSNQDKPSNKQRMSEPISLSCPKTTSFGKLSTDCDIETVNEDVKINETSSVRLETYQQYCMNSLEWYRIGAAYDQNICYPKEVTFEESAQQTNVINNMTGSKVKEFFKVNWKLLPLKLLIFFWSSAAFSILPYLTIHMKDIGISIDHIALIYAILPFTIFIAPPAVGYLADKLGSFTRVLFIMFMGTGIFHTVLLFVPTSMTITRSPSEVKFSLVNDTATLMWTPCEDFEQIKFDDFNHSIKCMRSNEFDKRQNTESIESVVEFSNITFNLNLEKCSFACPIDSIQVCESLTNMMICSKDKDNNLITLENISIKYLENASTACDNQKSVHVISGRKPLMIAPGCSLECTIQTPLPFDALEHMCTAVEGNTYLTFALYFVFRAIATMCLACCFTLIDAQTIQMCKEEEIDGKKGALGRQFVYAAISQAIVCPVIGQLMDFVSKKYGDGKPNYVVAFVSHDLFLFCGIVLLIFTKLNVQLPKSTGFEGIKLIFSSANNCAFLVVMFIIGSLWGFVETFLFVYLKDDMGAPMYLLGLTITVGAVVSIPFLFVSDYLVNRIGQNNTFIIALLAYSLRYVGYSYITNPWHAFPFEAMELFTINLFKVACAQYVGENAPPGLLATMNGITGCVHYGLGKGSGSLIGGYVISVVGSTAMTFRYFGVVAAVSGSLFFLFEYGYSKGLKAISQSKQKQKHRKADLSKDEKDKTICISEPLIKSKEEMNVNVKPNI